jgi:hypothetical protein
MHMMLAGFGVAAVILSAIVPVQAAEKSADARFKALYTREWTWREEQFAGEDDEDSESRSSIICPRSMPRRKPRACAIGRR